MISSFWTTNGSWRIFLKPNIFILFVSFWCHSTNDRHRPYNALLSFKTLPDYRYPGGIFIKIVLSKFVWTKAFTTSSCKVSRSNFAATTNSIHRDIIAKVVGLVGKSWFRCWLLYTISLTLHFCKFPCLSVLYLNTHLYPNTWFFSIS